MHDWQLLNSFIRGDHEAFATLVRRHINMVHATALRQVGQQHADDVTQAVFILLTQKHARIPRNGSLAGWLYRATIYVCSNVARTQKRREFHERKAGHMKPMTSEICSPWPLELLEPALLRLSSLDRQVVLLHFLESHSFAETGRALGITEEAARKRADRSLKKLRDFLTRHGYAVPILAITAILTKQAASAAPVIAVTSSIAASTGSATTAVNLLAKAAAKTMLLSQLKTAAMIALIATAAVGAIAAPVIIGQIGNDKKVLAADPPPAKTPAAEPTATPPLLAADNQSVADLAAYVIIADQNTAENLLARGMPEKVDTVGYTASRISADTMHQIIRERQKQNCVYPLTPEIATLWGNGRLMTVLSQVLVSEDNARRYNLPFSEAYGNWRQEGQSRLVQGNPLQLNIDHQISFDRARVNVNGDNPMEIPIAGSMHVATTLAAGEAIIGVSRNLSMRGGHEVNIIIVLEAFAASIAQQSLLPELGNMERYQWMNYGADHARWSAQRALNWQAMLPDTSPPATSRWVQKLEDGTTVRIVALTRQDIGAMCWWDGDGKPTRHSWLASNFAPNRYPSSLCVQVEASYPVDAWPKQNIEYQGQRIIFRRDTFNFDRGSSGHLETKERQRLTRGFILVDPDKTRIAVKIDHGEPRRLGIIEQKEGRQTIADRRIIVSPISFKNDKMISISFTDEEPRDDEELFATVILKDGTSVPLVTTPHLYPGGGSRTEHAVFSGSISNLQRTEVKEIELWARPIRTLLFDPLPAQPSVPIPQDIQGPATQPADLPPIEIGRLTMVDGVTYDPRTVIGTLLQMREAAQRDDLTAVRSFLYTADPEEEDLAQSLAQFLVACSRLQQTAQARFPLKDLSSIIDGGMEEMILDGWEIRNDAAYNRSEDILRMIKIDGQWKLDLRIQSHGGLYPDTYAKFGLAFRIRAMTYDLTRKNLQDGLYSSLEEARQGNGRNRRIVVEEMKEKGLVR